jgi:hypothetical protein
MDKLITPTEAAKELGISYHQFRRFGWIDLVDHIYTPGGHWRAWRSAVDRFKAQQMKLAEMRSEFAQGA